jgi:hypothetical protein
MTRANKNGGWKKVVVQLSGKLSCTSVRDVQDLKSQIESSFDIATVIPLTGIWTFSLRGLPPTTPLLV